MSDFLMEIMNIIGTIAFAMSGAYVAIEKKMDLLGVVILGITTAVGGGIIRDVLIGVTPPISLVNPEYVIIAIIVSLIMFNKRIHEIINLNNMIMIFVDALGLGAFTIVGCNSAIEFNNIMLQVFLGVLTGVGGGVLRDIFASRTPTIFIKNFYALASLIGGIIYSILLPYNNDVAATIGIVVIVTLRMLAAKYRWNLPKAQI